ncbi:hypothetical protein ANCCAN_00935 [Ancylostoma caninum]|uniref:Core-2/I-Branching enzyme n=1 Tax=Ancylostoma caninum TaxID=29170 RepID=A0A368HC25_ANCCA|nr:hypothetical protein ANCCAN_00935 [Ancylostoma caninum]
MAISLRPFSTKTPLRSEIYFSKPVVVLLVLFLVYTVFNPSESDQNVRWQKKRCPTVKQTKLLSNNQRDANSYVKLLALSRQKFIAAKQNMSCEAIKGRILPPKQLPPLQFGVAFARVVYKDYEFLEDELRSSYHPQNYFCYSIDKKADRFFTAGIRTLAKCLPNVIVTSD